MDGAQRRRVCQLIAGLVVADEDLDPAEDVFVDKMLAKFGIPQEERAVIFPVIDSEEAAISIMTLPADVRDEAFELLCEAAAADGQVVDEEREYLGKVAGAIGVSDADVEQRLAKYL